MSKIVKKEASSMNWDEEYDDYYDYEEACVQTFGTLDDEK
nr:MAG TPA: hypothetical protein [Caudoviricetes sp.]